MTKFKLYRTNHTGFVTVDIVEATDWVTMISQYMYAGDPVFKIEIYGTTDEPVEDIK